jgi:hypothetical protein
MLFFLFPLSFCFSFVVGVRARVSSVSELILYCPFGWEAESRSDSALSA